MVKDQPANAGDASSILGQEDPLEKERATHSSILAWEIPWAEKPGWRQSTVLQRVGHDLAIKQQQSVLGTVIRYPESRIEKVAQSCLTL